MPRTTRVPCLNVHFIASALKQQQPKNGEYFTEEDWSHTLVPDGGTAYTDQPFEGYIRSKVHARHYALATSHIITCKRRASFVQVTAIVSRAPLYFIVMLALRSATAGPLCSQYTRADRPR